MKRLAEVRRCGWLAVLGVALAGCGRDDAGTAADASGARPPWFTEVAAERGLVFEHVSGHDGKRYLFPEIMGGGGALFDSDGDGDLDAYLVQAGRLVGDGPPPGNRLFRNVGGGRFEDATEGSGADDRGYGMGVAAGDYDGDGRTDLYVTNVGPNALLRNAGEGRFVEGAHAAGADDRAWGTSSAFLDHDRDGDLDVFCVNYVHWAVERERTCSALPHGADYCSPLSYDRPARDTLLENLGDGTFADRSNDAGLAAAYGNGLGIGLGDFDSDGWIDAFVANDGMVNQLWMNGGDGRFRDEATQRGCAVDMNGVTKAGMGVQVQDVDGDGDEDVLVVNLHGEADSYYRNDGAYFTDRTPLTGLATVSRALTRFGCGLVDFDNDGYLDLYLANGRVTKAAELGPHGWFAEPNLLLRGAAGPRFERVVPEGGTDPVLIATSRAAVFGDVDDDGGVDVLVVNKDGPAQLLVNRAPARGRWILLSILEASGAPALGAVVTGRCAGSTVTRRVRSAYSYLAANDPRVHIGLGTAAELVDVRVRWTDGTSEAFGTLPAGEVVTLRRGAGTPD